MPAWRRSERVAHLGDVEGDLGDQRQRRTAGQSRAHRDVAGVATHDLEHHHPVVRLGGGVQPVDRRGGDVDRGVEPEAQLGGVDVVVDRLGHPDARDAVALEVPGGAQRPVATDDDEAVEPVALHRVADPVERRRRTGTAGSATCRGSCRPGAGSPGSDSTVELLRSRPRAHLARRRGTRSPRRRAPARPCAPAPGSPRSGRDSHRRRSAHRSAWAPPYGGAPRSPARRGR